MWGRRFRLPTWMFYLSQFPQMQLPPQLAGESACPT
jgi:hypothetical protein